MRHVLAIAALLLLPFVPNVAFGDQIIAQLTGAFNIVRMNGTITTTGGPVQFQAEPVFAPHQDPPVCPEGEYCSGGYSGHFDPAFQWWVPEYGLANLTLSAVGSGNYNVSWTESCCHSTWSEDNTFTFQGTWDNGWISSGEMHTTWFLNDAGIDEYLAQGYITTIVAPEPSTFVMLGSGMFALLGSIGRRVQVRKF